MMNEFMLTQASIALASFSAVLVLLPNTLLSLPRSALSPPKTGLIARVQRVRTRILKTSLVRECFERMELRRQRMHCLRELPCLLDVVILGLSAGFPLMRRLNCTVRTTKASSAHYFERRRCSGVWVCIPSVMLCLSFLRACA